MRMSSDPQPINPEQPESRLNRPADVDAAASAITETGTPREWRSIEELRGTEQFRNALEGEFGSGSDHLPDAAGRLMGALPAAGQQQAQEKPETVRPRPWDAWVAKASLSQALSESGEGSGLVQLQGAVQKGPANSAPGGDGLSRRDLLKVAAASAAMAGLSACTKLPTEKIVPYVRQPEEIIPGKPLFYATSMTLGGVATGVLVESHMARPTKVEGNPDHPASLGASDAFAQASILGLYDPDRSQAEVYDGRIGSWAAFQDYLSTALGTEKGGGGAGLRLLTPTITSPSLGEQIRNFLKGYPSAKW